MERKYNNYGGDRPCYTQPPVEVTGGFTLDVAQTNLTKGAIIPFGTLAHVDEDTRTAKLIKSARVVAIDSTNAKKVTLEADEFSKPLFVVGDKVHSDLTALWSDKKSISSMELTDAGLVVTLSAAIDGLAVGDALYEIVEGADVPQEGGTTAKGVALVAEPNAITIGEGYPNAEIKDPLTDTGIDVTRDSGCGEIYARRVPPVPAAYLDGNLLKGTKVSYTNSK